MRWLVIMAKVAFICNVAFLFCLIPVTKSYMPVHELQNVIIALAVLSIFINSIVNIIEFVLAAMRRSSPVQLWLRAFNFIIFSLQIAYYFLFNHAQYL